MQAPMGAVLCLADGTSVLTETIFENRFRYVDELRRMGAQIKVDGKTAIFEPAGELTGAPVCACDLRAGVALVVAGLAAKGRTEISGVTHIERGYEDIVAKLSGLGADIRSVDAPEYGVESKIG